MGQSLEQWLESRTFSVPIFGIDAVMEIVVGGEPPVLPTLQGTSGKVDDPESCY